MAMTMMDAAEEREKQRMEALGTANSVRIQRADLKDRVKSGETFVADVLDRVPEYAEGMLVAELLRAQRSWGRTRARKCLAAAAINETRTLGGLSLRQRALLIDVLETPSPYRCPECGGRKNDRSELCRDCRHAERRGELEATR